MDFGATHVTQGDFEGFLLVFLSKKKKKKRDKDRAPPGMRTRPEMMR